MVYYSSKQHHILYFSFDWFTKFYYIVGDLDYGLGQWGDIDRVKPVS